MVSESETIPFAVQNHTFCSVKPYVLHPLTYVVDALCLTCCCAMRGNSASVDAFTGKNGA